MKPVDVKSGTYIKFDVENHHKDPKIKAGDYIETFLQKFRPKLVSESFWDQKSKKYCTMDI